MEDDTPNLRQAVADAALTIADLVEATGKSQQSVYAWLSGVRKPPMVDRTQLVHLLGVSAKRLDAILDQTKAEREARSR